MYIREGFICCALSPLLCSLFLTYRLPDPVYGVDIKHVWTRWGQWSPCSVTCGRGTRSRRRWCVGQIGSRLVGLQEPSCVGTKSSQSNCLMRACIDPHAVRQQKCSEQDKNKMFGRTFKWFPYIQDSSSCDLTCMAKGTHFFYNFGRAPDDMSCKKDGVSGVCVSGKCFTIGCDGKLGSDLKIDMCGVCGGKNRSCMHVVGVFTKSIGQAGVNFGYNEVVRIPKGARHIIVKDESSNFLAITDSNKSFIINGNWIFDWPGKFQVGDTTFHYSRTWNNHEVINATGPLQEDFYLMVILRSQNKGIFYEFWISRNQHFQRKMNRVSAKGTSVSPSEWPLTSTLRPTDTDIVLKRQSGEHGEQEEDLHEGIVLHDTDGNHQNGSMFKTTKDGKKYNQQNNGVVNQLGRDSLGHDTHSRITRQSNKSVDEVLPPGKKEPNFSTIAFETTQGTLNKHGDRSNQEADPNERWTSRKEDLRDSLRHAKSESRGPPSTSDLPKKGYAAAHGLAAASVKTLASYDMLIRNINRTSDKPKSYKGPCRACRRIKNRRKHYCSSDFAVHARVVNYKFFGNNTRYEVKVNKVFKSSMMLLKREYIWARDKCFCPRLKRKFDYLIMGYLATSNDKREIQLRVNRDSFVRRYNMANQKRMEKLKRSTKCGTTKSSDRNNR